MFQTLNPMQKVLPLFLCLFITNIAVSQSVKFKGQIKSPNSDSIMVSSRTFKKVIYLDKNHSFKGELDIDEDGFYRFYDGMEAATIYLEKGYDLTMNLETAEFDETIRLSGIGETISNFFFQKYLYEESEVFPRLKIIDSNEFKLLVDSLRTVYISDLYALALSESEKKAGIERIERSMKSISGSFSREQKIKLLDRFIGQPLGEYQFETATGEKFSTKNLIGKPTYIDVWATWCGPCLGELPDLKALEEEYGADIQFLSISIDEAKNREKWQKMIVARHLEGIQVIADKAWKSDFAKMYEVYSIPRFMIVDSNGIIVSPNAPRPSDEAIKTELNKLMP